jgi:hypothetical protein
LCLNHVLRKRRNKIIRKEKTQKLCLFLLVMLKNIGKYRSAERPLTVNVYTFLYFIVDFNIFWRKKMFEDIFLCCLLTHILFITKMLIFFLLVYLSSKFVEVISYPIFLKFSPVKAELISFCCLHFYLLVQAFMI